ADGGCSNRTALLLRIIQTDREGHHSAIRQPSGGTLRPRDEHFVEASTIRTRLVLTPAFAEGYDIVHTEGVRAGIVGAQERCKLAASAIRIFSSRQLSVVSNQRGADFVRQDNIAGYGIFLSVIHVARHFALGTQVSVIPEHH